MKTIDLPEGKHALLRDVADLTVKQRRLVQASGLLAIRRLSKLSKEELAVLQRDGDTASDDGDFDRLAGLMQLIPEDKQGAMEYLATQDDAILAFLASWDLDQPLPRTGDEVSDLAASVYDVLAAAVAPMVQGIVTGGSGVDFDPKPNTPEHANAPFVVSATSNSSSETQD